jgi:hypothetical protein
MAASMDTRRASRGLSYNNGIVDYLSTPLYVSMYLYV